MASREDTMNRPELPSEKMFGTEDYPAAHSMDIEFFALDREGNIAQFRAYLDEYSEPAPAFQIEKSRTQLTKHVEASLESCLRNEAESDERDISAFRRRVVFDFVYKHDGDGNSVLYREGDLPPESPELLQAELSIHSPNSKYSLDFPWLSFDDASVLKWPPDKPSSVAEWEEIRENATQHWLDALKEIKSAERRQPDRVAYWQKIADRRYASLQVLEQRIELGEDR